MSQPPTIVSIREAPERFAMIRAGAAFAEIEAHPQTGAYARLYYPAVHGDACRDVSFAVLVDDKPAAVVLCTILSGKLCLYGLPLRLFLADEAAANAQQLAVKAALVEIDRLAALHGATEVVVRDEAGPTLTELGVACLGREARADVKVVADVDLTLGEEAWRQALRRRYRSLVNWGQRSLAIEIVDRANPDKGTFDRFREFHRRIAGRVTRPLASWDVMSSHVADGGGELILGTLDGRLVSAILFVDGTRTTIYMTGVFDREHFDKPLAHYVMWLGMERAKARGRARFELGDVEFRGLVDDKNYQIGYFKRGFATRLATHLVWRWSPPAGGGRS